MALPEQASDGGLPCGMQTGGWARGQAEYARVPFGEREGGPHWSFDQKLLLPEHPA